MSVNYDLFVNNDLTVLNSLSIGVETPTEISAIFEVSSTSKGLLFPRMTSAERLSISTPASGLMVYDTTNKALYYYSGNGSEWTMLVKNTLDDTNVLLGNGNTGLLLSTGAGSNVILGRDSGQSLLTTSNNTIVGDSAAIALLGSNNIIMGANAVEFATTIDDCVVIGESAGDGMTTGDKNTIIGKNSGNVLASGSNCLLLGHGSDAAAGLDNQIAIGFSAVSDKANQAMIGDATLVEMVPNAGASADLGTPTNPWNELHIKGEASLIGPIAIGQSSSADPSAIFELESTTSGLLLPRMTTTQKNAITSPATGLMVYDITKDAIYYYNGSVWVITVRNTVDESNIIVGNNTSGDGLISGSGNIIIGRDCADVYNSNESVFIGDNVLELATDSSQSVIIGANSGNLITTGSIKNTSCGESTFLTLTTGTRNTALGNQSGNVITTGLNNTMIGSNTAGAANLSNQTALGYDAISDKANQVMIGDSNVIEMVPNASATANLGTSTNPWNNTRFKGNASIGSATDPVTSALVELTSTTQGLLVPRMTTVQRTSIVSPVDGLMVYDTDRRSIFVYSGGTGSWFNELARRRFNAVFTQIIPVITIVNAPTWTAIPWNTEILKDADFTHTADSTDITFNATDTYLLTYSVVFITNGNNKVYQARVEVDTGGGFNAIPYSNIFGRSSGGEGITINTTFYHPFNTGDIIRVTGQSISNSTDFTAQVDSCNITINRV